MTRGRKPLPPVETIDMPATVMQVAHANAANANALISLEADAQARHQAVALQFAEGVAYERERVITEARYLMAASADAMLEAGKRLIQIKENEPHGDFIDIVTNRLGLGERSARSMMAAALKYLQPQLAGQRAALLALGKTKLFDLAFEADDDLAALADGGTLAGATLDEIDAMTSRELRARLRDAKADLQAKDRLLADKNERIDRLSTERDFRLADETKAQLDDLASATAGAEVQLIRLAQVVGRVANEGGAPLRKRAQQAVQYLVAHLAELVDENGIEVSLAEGLNQRPEWLVSLPDDAAAEPAAHATQKAPPAKHKGRR